MQSHGLENLVHEMSLLQTRPLHQSGPWILSSGVMECVSYMKRM